MVTVDGRGREDGSSQVASSDAVYLTPIHSCAIPHLSFSNSGPTRRVEVGRATREAVDMYRSRLELWYSSTWDFSVSLFFLILRVRFCHGTVGPGGDHFLSFPLSPLSLSLKLSILKLSFCHKFHLVKS